MIADEWKEKISGRFVFTKKGQFQVDFIQAKILSGMEENSAKWMADWSRLTFLSYSCSFFRKLTAYSNSQVVSPLALTLKCLIVTKYLTVVSLIYKSNWSITLAPPFPSCEQSRPQQTGGSPKTSAPAQLRPTTERALFCSASYSLTLRRSTRPLVQPTQKSYNCITITIYIWVSSEHTTISSLPDIYF